MSSYRLEHLRIMGVLQRIGVAYVIGALITLRGTWQQHLIATPRRILLGYWALMTLVVVPDQRRARAGSCSTSRRPC